MNQKATAFALAFMVLSSAAMAQSAQSAQSEVPLISGADPAYPYHLIPTTNIWTQILLDTANGRAWQVQFSTGQDSPTGKWVINDSSLLPKGVVPKNGRFALYPTKNMYTFLLLDRQDSRLWQLQWSTESEKRGIVRSISNVQPSTE